MDKIEKIKVELERRISRCEKKHPPLMSDKEFTDEQNEIYCEERAYREILSFIDSLQDEPIVKDSKVSEEIDQNEIQVIEKNDNDIITFNDVATILISSFFSSSFFSSTILLSSFLSKFLCIDISTN